MWVSICESQIFIHMPCWTCCICIVRRLVTTVMQAMPSLSSFVFAHKFLMEFPRTYPRRILVLCGCGRTVSQSTLADQFFGLRPGARWLLMSSGRCLWAIWLHVFFSLPSLTATFAHWKCHIRVKQKAALWEPKWDGCGCDWWSDKYSEGNLIPCTDTVVVAKCIDSWIMDQWICLGRGGIGQG